MATLLLSDIVRNNVKEKLARGEVVASITVRLTRGIEIVRIAKTAGFDSIYVDLEHSSLSLDATGQICMAALEAGLAPFVRVPANTPDYIQRALDGGALGVIAPNIRSAEEARAVVAAVKYPPLGGRGASGGLPHLHIGIWISGGTYGSGTLVGWKESGGYGGTFSPNAAFVQTQVTLVAATQYTIKLQWKTNKVTSSTIVAGAGAGPVYSPTRLTLRLFPTANTLVDGSTNKQYNKAGSTGADWTPVDGTGLKLTVMPTANSLWVLSANADLFTATAGINQDLGIFISGGVYGTGTLVAWKESGGYGGTFSPNAAFVQTVIPLQTAISYTITLEWKANRATNGTIYAAAGSGPAPNYSPTRITAQLLS